MTLKCKYCGGTCYEKSNGEYECNFCGATFDKEDFMSTREIKVNSETKKNTDNGVEVFDKNINGVLEITMTQGSGSGYLISSDGYGITNSHVVALENGKSCGQCYVKVANETVQATVIAMGTEDKSKHCSNLDLALIKLSHVPQKATPLQFATSIVHTGERIFVIGNSLGAGTCITSGIISDNNRNGQLMYDCPTNPGNSGGPVFNADGYIIGTHVAGVRPNEVKVQGMNIAIPASAVIDFIEQVQKKLGIKF